MLSQVALFPNWRGMMTDGGIEDCKAQTVQFGPNTVGEETIQAVSRGKSGDPEADY